MNQPKLGPMVAPPDFVSVRFIQRLLDGPGDAAAKERVVRWIQSAANRHRGYPNRAGDAVLRWAKHATFVNDPVSKRACELINAHPGNVHAQACALAGGDADCGPDNARWSAMVRGGRVL